MAQQGPGLEPRQLDGEVVIAVESPDPARSTASEPEPAVTQEAPQDVSDNTEAHPQADERNVNVETQAPEMSQREANRMQALANAKAQAEARAAQAEEMLRRLVNNQTAPPTVSDEEMLARQFKSYDANAGYPTDPKEYVQFNSQQAAMAAQKAALQAARQQAESADYTQMIIKHPDVASDTVLQGIIAAKRSEASRQGTQLSYTQAADIAKEELEKRYTTRATARQVEDTQEKNEAYVETTRGASTNRAAVTAPSADKPMSLTEMERYLKSVGEW